MKKILAKLVSGVVAMAAVAMTFVAVPMFNASAASKVTVYYKNSTNWKQVYAYFWYDQGSTGAAWPGAQMKDLGNGWLEATYTGSKPLDVIFSNNEKPKASQTANHEPKDLDNTKSAYWFVPTESKKDNPGGMGSGATVKVYSEPQSGFPTPTAAKADTKAADTKAAPAATTTAAAKTATKDKTPKTGDINMLPVAGAVAIVSLAGIAVAAKKKSK